MSRQRPDRACWATGLVATFLVLTALACQGGGQASPSSSTRPAPTQTVSAQEKGAWLKCGASAAPPAAVVQQVTDVPRITNSTSGAVTDSDARTWVAAFLREQVIETWAQTALQEGLLQVGCLGDPAAIGLLFGTEIDMVHRARQANAKVLSTLPRIEDVRLVAVPADVQARVAAQAGAKSGYALIVHGRGPAQTTIAYQDGRQEVVSETRPNEAYYAFYGGEYRQDSQGIGPLWYQKSVFACQQQFLRSLCGI